MRLQISEFIPALQGRARSVFLAVRPGQRIRRMRQWRRINHHLRTPRPRALHQANTERRQAGGAQHRNAQITVMARRYRPLKRLALPRRQRPFAPNRRRFRLVHKVFFVTQPQPAVAYIILGRHQQHRLAAGKHLVRHRHFQPQSQQLAQVQQAGHHRKTQQPKRHRISQVHLILQPHQPQQRYHHQQAHAQTGRAHRQLFPFRRTVNRRQLFLRRQPHDPINPSAAFHCFVAAAPPAPGGWRPAPTPPSHHPATHARAPA